MTLPECMHDETEVDDSIDFETQQQKQLQLLHNHELEFTSSVLHSLTESFKRALLSDAKEMTLQPTPSDSSTAISSCNSESDPAAVTATPSSGPPACISNDMANNAQNVLQRVRSDRKTKRSRKRKATLSTSANVAVAVAVNSDTSEVIDTDGRLRRSKMGVASRNILRNWFVAHIDKPYPTVSIIVRVQSQNSPNGMLIYILTLSIF
jgi:hypothetical protein